MAKSIRIRRTAGADRCGCLAVGAFLAALAGPAAADECSDYRTALVQYHATDRALDEAVAKLTDDDLDSGEAEAKLRPYHATNDRALATLGDAQLAVASAIDDEAVATAMGAIYEAGAAIARAFESVSGWHERATGVVPLTRSNAASFELGEAFDHAERALVFALNVACREGAP